MYIYCAKLGQVKPHERNRSEKKLAARVPSFEVTPGHWNQHGTIGYL